MIEVRYSKRTLWGMWFGAIPIVIGALWIGQYYKDPRLFSAPTLGVVAAIFAIAALRIATSDGIALQADRSGLTLSGVWRKRRFAWRDVGEIDLARSVLRSHGQDAPGSTLYLRIFPLVGKEIRLNCELFDRSVSEAPALLGELLALKHGAPEVPGASARRSPAHRDVLEGAPRADIGNARPVFGRKGP